MASDAHEHTKHVKDKGKGPALDVETILLPTSDSSFPETCVICLDRISEKAVALPCKHDQFDFPCLGTWLQQSQVCPLCKAEVKAIKYDVKQEDVGSKIFHLPPREIPKSRPARDINRRTARSQRYHPYGRRSGHEHAQLGWREQAPRPGREDRAIEFRKEVYRKKTYSAYVGANRLSRYRNITCQSFATNTELVNRAKMFIRRELRVFDFLNPSSNTFSPGSDRRANNAEFLLEYIIGILKSMDLKGSAGQAEELLKDFLGDHAKLFLHELEAWLRSPYEKLGDWDKHVQYGNIVQVGESSTSDP